MKYFLLSKFHSFTILFYSFYCFLSEYSQINYNGLILYIKFDIIKILLLVEEIVMFMLCGLVWTVQMGYSVQSPLLEPLFCTVDLRAFPNHKWFFHSFLGNWINSRSLISVFCRRRRILLQLYCHSCRWPVRAIQSTPSFCIAGPVSFPHFVMVRILVLVCA